MGSSGSTVGSWVRASQSLPPYGIRAPPWQDVAAHAAHTGAGHQWWCARMVYRSSPAWRDSIARNPVLHNFRLPCDDYGQSYELAVVLDGVLRHSYNRS